MSNRRKPRAERVNAERCPRCRCRDYLTKVFQDGTRGHVCQRCDATWLGDPA